jgi:hypothetical protein
MILQGFVLYDWPVFSMVDENGNVTQNDEGEWAV